MTIYKVIVQYPWTIDDHFFFADKEVANELRDEYIGKNLKALTVPVKISGAGEVCMLLTKELKRFQG